MSTPTFNLSVLMRDIGDALRLDNEGNEKEAYKKYVGCIYTIAANLLGNLKLQGDVYVNKATVKQIKLAQQCTDRVAEIITALDSMSGKASTSAIEPTLPSTSTKTSNPQTPLSSDAAKAQGQKVQDEASMSVTKGSHVAMFPEERGSGRFSTPVPTLPTQNNPYAFVARKSRPMTPMEKASKQNQSLMTVYKARMKRLNRSDQSAFDLSLNIQRKMAENIAIAKAQEEELARKMQARNQRLEQEAAKRFASPSALSKEEQEKKAFYKSILDYESEAPWLKDWRLKLAAQPEDPVLICQLMQEVLRCSDHPITELLQKYQLKIYQRLFPLVENKIQRLSQLTVPFPEHLWPPFDDVKDIVGDNRDSPEPSQETPKIAEKCDSKDEKVNTGNVYTKSKDETQQVSFIPEVSQGSTKMEESNTSSQVSCIESEKSDTSLHLSERSLKTDINELEEETIFKVDGADLSSDHNVSSSKDSVSNGAGPQAETGDKTLSNIEGSWEMRQAKFLMRQVSRGYSDQTDTDRSEDDDLDYLFDNTDEGVDSGSESMYSSIGYMNLPVGKNEKDGGPLALGRSVSHESQLRRLHCDSRDRYTSLPYDNPNKRCADEEEKKKLAKLSLEACNRHLSSICEDIHCYLEKLLNLMVVAYESLDTPIGRDQCALSLEEPFFKPIWKTLLQLFRVVNYRQEQVLACVLTKFFSSSPGALEVNKNFWLTDGSALLSPSSTTVAPWGEPGKQRPYERAIVALKQVGDHYTMLNKLECVVKVCRLICECVDDHYKNLKEKEGKRAPSIGADDLLPILCYVVVQSGMPQLASECHAMSEFIHEGYLMGEEGYCLTTLRTALDYVTSLYPRS